MQLQTREVDIETLADLIRNGYSICSEFNPDYLSLKDKTNQNFKQSNLIILDFDHSVIALEDALNCVRIEPTIAFKTYSNTNTDYRFKLIYLFEEHIKSVSDFKRKSMMMFYLLFNQKEFDLIKPAFDISSISPVQLCNGTNQEVKVFDTVISIDSINQSFEFNEEPFNTFEEVFDLMGINIVEDNELTEVSQTKKSEENKKNNTDFFYFPSVSNLCTGNLKLVLTATVRRGLRRGVLSFWTLAGRNAESALSLARASNATALLLSSESHY